MEEVGHPNAAAVEAALAVYQGEAVPHLQQARQGRESRRKAHSHQTSGR